MSAVVEDYKSRASCKSLLVRCVGLYNRGGKKDVALLCAARYKGDYNVLRDMMASEDFYAFFDSYDISSLSDVVLSRIGQLMYNNDSNGEAKNGSTWGRYNTSVTLRLYGDTLDDDAYISNIIRAHNGMLIDLLHSFVNPVHGILTVFNFNRSTTVGGAVSVRDIMSKYTDDNKHTGYTTLRKVFVKRVKENMDRIHSNYEFRAKDNKPGGIRNVPFSLRDAYTIYAKFINILVNLEWDHIRVKEYLKNMNNYSVKLGSLNSKFNTYYDNIGNPIDRVVSINQDGLLILFGCSKYKYDIVDIYPNDRKYMKLSLYFKRAIISYDSESSAVYLKLMRYSTEVQNDGHLDIDDIENINVSSHNMKDADDSPEHDDITE